MGREDVYTQLKQWCKDNWLYKWSISSQDWKYKVFYIVIPVYLLHKFIKKNNYLNNYDDWYFVTEYEWCKVNESEVYFLLHNQFSD